MACAPLQASELHDQGWPGRAIAGRVGESAVRSRLPRSPAVGSVWPGAWSGLGVAAVSEAGARALGDVADEGAQRVDAVDFDPECREHDG